MTRRVSATAGTVAGVLLIAAIAIAFLPMSEVPVSTPLLPPGWPAILGTDRLGRDVLALTLSAVAYSSMWAAIVLAGAVALGLPIAVVSATWWQRWPDQSIATIADAIRSFPVLVLALLFATVGVPVNLMLLTYFWIPVWRVLRTQVGAQRMRPYVMASILSGHSRFRAVAVHALPNAMAGFVGVLIVVFVEILTVQAGLEFLGFATPMSRPTLGNMTSEALRLGGAFAWVWLPSAILVSVLAIALSIFGKRAFRAESRELE